MFENTDDYDFTPSSSSNLSALFGNSVPLDPNESNKSLMYTAPKEPTIKNYKINTEESRIKPVAVQQSPSPLQQQQSSQSAVICAKVVTLYKLEQNKYNSLGKHGLAIIGSTEKNLYEIIIYKEKNNIITRVNLNESFNFVNQNDSFSSFYDTSKQNWLVLFETIQDRTFLSELIEKYGGKVLSNNNNTETKECEQETAKVNNNNSRETEEEDLTKREDILLRIAKMGQSILTGPLPGGRSNSLEYSDSDSSDAVNTISISTPSRKTKKVEPPAQLMSQAVVTQQYSNPYQVSTNTNDPMLTSFLMDNRMQNSEIRLNLAEIKMKLDCVLNGANTNNCANESSGLKSKIKALELRNENLMSELEQYGDSQQKVNALETEIDTLQSSHRKENLQLENEIERFKIDLETSEKLVEIQKLKLKDFEEFYNENKNNSNLTEEITELNGQINNLKLKLQDFEGYFNESEKIKEARTKHDKEFKENLKETMNVLFESILDKFNVSEKSDDEDDFKQVLAQTIKRTTYKILKDFDAVCLQDNKKIPLD